ncbi:MAG: FkbM family methyltransferase [Candidatus Sericytochromatia bacterium]
MAFRLKTLREITTHPLTRHAPLAALRRYGLFHLSQRLFPYPIVYPWIGPLQLLARKGWAGVVGNLYTGLYDFEDMGFLLHGLRPDDLFVDIGANAGVYSLLAAGLCQSRVLAIEPLPETFAQLQTQIRLNRLEALIDARQLGLSNQTGQLYFSTGLGTMNHVVSKPAAGEAVIEVPVCRLDQLLQTPVRMLKIDTEGFELPVLQGADACLSRPELQAIIIELNGSGQHYGYSDQAIDTLLRGYGFAPFRYLPFERRLEPLEHWRSDQHNTLYLRKSDTLLAELAQAPRLQVLGQSF